jgi:hypothetical protein
MSGRGDVVLSDLRRAGRRGPGSGSTTSTTLVAEEVEVEGAWLRVAQLGGEHAARIAGRERRSGLRRQDRRAGRR